MKRLLMFQTAEELNRLKHSFNLFDKTNLLLALTPEADYAAEKLKLEYKTIEDFYSDPELMELGIQNFANVRDFCVELDLHLSQALKDIPEAEAISTHDDFYDLKRLFDALLHRTFTLTSAITKVSPELIVYFGYPSFKRDIKSDIENNLLISRIIPIIARKLSIKTVVLPCHKITENFDLFKKAFKYTLINQLSKFPRARILVSELVKLRKRLLFNENIKPFTEMLSRDNNSITLIGDPDSPFDDGRVIRKWIDSGTGNSFTLCQIMEIGENTSRKEIYRFYATARKACTNAWKQIDCNSIREFFQIAGLDLYPLVKPFLKDYICSTIPARVVSARKLRIGLRRIRKGAIVMPYVPGWVANIARQAGIPTVAFQHGGGYGYLDLPITEHELLGTDYFFCYGPGVSEFYETPSPNAHLSSDTPRPIPLPIGSPCLDILKQREQRLDESQILRDAITQSRRAIIYVMTNLTGDRRYFSYHTYPDIWYWRLQREIIQVCTEFVNIHLIVKLYPPHPVKNPLGKWIRQKSFSNCEMVQDKPFIDMLGQADLFIIDYPSTMLLQALTTDKPIIAFAERRSLRLDPSAARLLRKRVIFSETKEEFLRDIVTVLSQLDRWTSLAHRNDEFLRAYGTYLNDGNSAERAKQVLLKILQNQYALKEHISGVNTGNMRT